ncbi:MAG: endonuclease [Myxococcota bacterium]
MDGTRVRLAAWACVVTLACGVGHTGGVPSPPRAEAQEAGGAEAPAADGRAPESASRPPPRLEDLPPGFVPPARRPERELSYGSTARRLLGRLYAERRTTFYCDCAFDADKRVDAASCGFAPGERWRNRAERVEWEHVVPASVMLRGRPCATDPEREGSPRAWCRRVDPAFRAMEGDLHNLVPAVGQLNAERSNHPYGEVPGEPRRFGACDFEVEDGVVEPAPPIRGDIARIHAYMATTYGLDLDPESSRMMARWGLQDPPTVEERALWNAGSDVLGVTRRWKPPAAPLGPVVRRQD